MNCGGGSPMVPRFVSCRGQGGPETRGDPRHAAIPRSRAARRQVRGRSDGYLRVWRARLRNAHWEGCVPGGESGRDRLVESSRTIRGQSPILYRTCRRHSCRHSRDVCRRIPMTGGRIGFRVALHTQEPVRQTPETTAAPARRIEAPNAHRDAAGGFVEGAAACRQGVCVGTGSAATKVLAKPSRFRG